MIDDKVAKIIRYIARESESESALLYPNPSHLVESIGLLDEIVKVYGLDKNDVSDIVDIEVDN